MVGLLVPLARHMALCVCVCGWVCVRVCVRVLQLPAYLSQPFAATFRGTCSHTHTHVHQEGNNTLSQPSSHLPPPVVSSFEVVAPARRYAFGFVCHGAHLPRAQTSSTVVSCSTTCPLVGRSRRTAPASMPPRSCAAWSTFTPETLCTYGVWCGVWSRPTHKCRSLPCQLPTLLPSLYVYLAGIET